MLDAAIVYLGHLFGGYLSKLLEKHADQMTTYARAFRRVLAGLDLPEISWDSLAIANEMYETIGPLLEKYRAPGLPDRRPARGARRLRSVHRHRADQRPGGEPVPRLGHDRAVQHAQPVPGC